MDGLDVLGYVNGDRSISIVLGTSDIDGKIKSGKFRVRNLVPGTNRVTSNITVLIDYEWDIQLYVTRGAEMATETELSYMKVL